MSRVILSIVGLLSVAHLAHAEVSPQDFAYGQAAIPAENAAAARFSLPLSVYQNTYQTDLADVRIFNGEGIVVPYSLSRPATPSPIHRDLVPLPLFPLHEGARVLIDGVHLTINSAGSAVNLQTQNGHTTESAVRQYLLDARAMETEVSALQLEWPELASEFTGRLHIEVSDDLATWRSVVAAAPIANLRANGQTLIENRVQVPPAKAKFWRLSWLGVAPSFELTKILAEPAAGPAELKRESLEVIGASDPKNAQEVTFDLNAHPPVSRLNLLLPDVNTVTDVEISSRATPTNPWRPVTRAGFYRIKTSDGEQRNAVLEVAPNTDRFWRARVLSVGNSLGGPPRLQVEWVPNDVTFLVQGHAPFLLAYGNAAATRAEADLNNLPTTLKIAPATLGPSQVLGGPSRLIAKPSPFPRTRVALWGVLLLAVMVLSWMAYRISKESDQVPQ